MRKKYVFILFVLLLAACSSPSPAGTPVNNSNAENEAAPLAEIDDSPTSAAPEAEEPTEAATTAVEPTEPAEVQPTLTPPPPPEPEPTETAEAPAVDTAVEPEAVQPGTGTIPVEASDGLSIQTSYAYPGGVPPYPGVILLHMLGGNRTIWDETGMTEALLRDGVAVMTVDMRGHGETGGDQDWELARDDMQRIWETFVAQPEVDPEKTAIVGASIGSNLALITAVNEPTINTAVLLSPGLDYRGVTTEDQIAPYGTRPILIMASSEDSYAADSSETLHGLAQGDSELLIFNGLGHGTTMLKNDPDLVTVVVDWLRGVLRGDA